MHRVLQRVTGGRSRKLLHPPETKIEGGVVPTTKGVLLNCQKVEKSNKFQRGV